MSHSSVRADQRPEERSAAQARAAAAEWIRRQMRWEQTLADLRAGKRSTPFLRKAA